jgi:hypothetical protein
MTKLGGLTMLSICPPIERASLSFEIDETNEHQKTGTNCLRETKQISNSDKKTER